MELLNYFSFPIQSNIYGLSCLHTNESTDRLLVATLERQIFCIENKQNKFSCKEVHFTYIPNGANIISIDTYRRSQHEHDFVVGITFVKTDKDPSEVLADDKNGGNSSTSGAAGGNGGGNGSGAGTPSDKSVIEHYYFNIYASLGTLQDFDLNTIAQDCQTFDVEFVPYHLYHTDLYLDDTGDHREQVWILSGSDCCAHIYREDKEKQCFYEESAPETYFPELSELGSIAMWIDIYNVVDADGCRRVTAVGLENGVIQLSIVEFDTDTGRHAITRLWRLEYDGPVLSCRLFTDQSNSVGRQSEFLDKLRSTLNINQSTDNPIDTNIHLLVTNSIESSVVYRDVLMNGLNKRYVLPQSRRCDTTVTSCVADIDMDATNEIIIGTYGHELIVYKYIAESDSYVLLWERLFAHPLQSIAYLDLTGDGLKELIVLTVKGLHVLQHNLENTVQLCHKRVKQLLKRLDMSA